MADYSYSFGEFPAEETAEAKVLRRRVTDDEDISTELSLVVVDPDAEEVVYSFASELSQAEQDALDALVAAYEFETLDEMKTERIMALDLITKDYMHDHYPAFDLDFWNGLLTDAVGGGLANRANYIGAILSWAMNISQGYFDPKKTTIAAASSKAEVEAVTFSYDDCASTFDSSDPDASIAAALAIPD